ncbi:Lrp/AsnC family transcriptional regulator [Endozoicomonadaceae bacterium StTr2]
MDLIDKKILMCLQEDATLPLAEVAARVNLSSTPCWKRIKRLEKEGIIQRRVTLLDPAKVGLGVSVFVQLKTARHDTGWLRNFARQVASFPEVAESYRMSGEWDYLLRVVVKDIAAFDQFYKKLVSSVDGLSDVTSSFAMEQMHSTTVLPLN